MMSFFRYFSGQPGVVAVIFMSTGLLSACSERQIEDAAPRPVAWVEVTPFSGGEQRRLPGLVRAAQRAPLGFEVAGRIVRMNVDTGESFNEGDVLARLDDRNYRLALNERKANLADARARLVEAGKTLARKKELMARKVGSQAAVDGAQAAYDSTAAQVDRLAALANLAREDLDDIQLRAPYDGEVLQRLAEPSQQVAAGQTVFEVQGAAGHLEVIVSVPETVVGRLQRGDMAEIVFPARPTETPQGEVTEIGAGAVERNAFPVTLRLADGYSDIRPGMTAEVEFQLDAGAAEEGQLAIPVTAFLPGAGQEHIAYVLNTESNSVHRREIELSRITGDQALVKAGLEAGEIIVAKGLAFLHDGQTVRRLGVGTRVFQQ